MYKKAILGGTFDHFHLGHQKLIDTAFEQSEHITLGITMPNMYQHKFLAQTIEAYDTREKNLKQYLEEKNLLNRATIIPIENIYGTTLQDDTIQAIFVTVENLPNVDLINNKRKEKGFANIKPVVVAYVKDATDKNITSERIRKGEIDRTGFVYQQIFEKKDTFTLSENLRQELHEPIGEIITQTEDVLPLLQNTFVIAVGDIISSKLSESGFVPHISIIDFKTRRHDLPHANISGKTVNNPRGTINSEAALTIYEMIGEYLKTQKNATLIVDGEEDLLALPAILLAPLGSVVLYGQFDQGVVINHVSEELKKKIQMLLKKFQ